MSRVQFIETVTLPLGVGGSLLPVAGIAAVPHVVDSNGVEGGQANAYTGRSGSVAAPSLNTDANGTISYWLEAGDYNVHFTDQQSPPRIATYIRGFTAPIINTDQIIVAAQNLIQFTGDTKFSMQTVDHGVKADGTFEWLLVNSASDGGGRLISHLNYAGLWQLMGSPAADVNGNFRLPNISGRALIAAGAATGLTARNLLDLVGEENHLLAISQLPSHDHTGLTGSSSSTGPTSQTNSSGGTITEGFNHENAPIGSSWQGQVATTSGPAGYTSATFPYASGGYTNQDLAHDHFVTVAILANSMTFNIPQLSISAQGGGQSHNNMQPSAGMNLFVKT